MNGAVVPPGRSSFRPYLFSVEAFWTASTLAKNPTRLQVRTQSADPPNSLVNSVSANESG